MHWFAWLKSQVRKLPGIHTAIFFIREPRHELKCWQEYWQFRRRYGAVMSNRGMQPRRGRVLVVNQVGNWAAAVHAEGWLIKAYQARGYEPIVVTTRGVWANRYYRLFGVRSFVYLEEELECATNHVPASGMATVPHFSSFADLMAYEYRHVKVGKYVCSSLIRAMHAGSVEVTEPATQQRIALMLRQTMTTVVAVERIYDRYQPQAMLCLERGYTPFGEFFDLAINRGLNVIQWCGCHRETSLMFKRYHRGNTDHHPAALSDTTWQWLTTVPWSAAAGNRVRHELLAQYASGNWFSEVGTQFFGQIMERDKIIAALGLDPQKKIAVIFSHLFWDATFFWGEDLFADYQEWFIATIKAAAANPAVQWIVKVHPANVVKLHRDGYQGELVEKLAIRQAIGSLPSHMHILEPTTPISTYSLLSVMDYCLTVRGTIGIESALFGVRVCTAGTGRYDRRGFTVDSDSCAEYLDRLAHLTDYPPLTPSQREQAEKFAYGTFLLRPYNPVGMEMHYGKTKDAPLSVHYQLGSSADRAAARHAWQELGHWLVDSTDEDYLDQRAVAQLLNRE